MSFLQAVDTKILKNPVVATAAGFTGSYVDMQGLSNVHNYKAVLLAGAGTTVGTCGGSVQAADDTAGTNLETVATFDTLATIGGSSVKHFHSIRRYVRVLGSVQTGKDMLLASFVQNDKLET